MKIRPANHGFSLVELSIVLAILGLLAGGILVGQALIQSARIKTVMNSLSKYRVAYNQFQQQYQAIPGDFADATEQWGVDAVTGGCSTPSPVAADRVAKKATCNGNGNSLIVAPEQFRAWQHLANAGLIDGSFTGVGDATGASGATGGENVPAGPMESSAFYMDTSGPFVGNPSYFDQGVFTEIAFGAKTSGSWPQGSILSPQEQYSIDLKADDGRPSAGWMRSLKNACATTAVDATAEYAITTDTKSCTVWLMIQPTS